MVVTTVDTSFTVDTKGTSMVVSHQSHAPVFFSQSLEDEGVGQYPLATSWGALHSLLGDGVCRGLEVRKIL